MCTVTSTRRQGVLHRFFNLPAEPVRDAYASRCRDEQVEIDEAPRPGLTRPQRVVVHAGYEPALDRLPHRGLFRRGQRMIHQAVERAHEETIGRPQNVARHDDRQDRIERQKAGDRDQEQSTKRRPRSRRPSSGADRRLPE